MPRTIPALAVAALAALAALSGGAAAQDTTVPPTTETCREISRGTASDNSGDELVVRECRRPRAAAATAPARPARGIRLARDPDWRPGPDNDPKNCRSLWETIGRPTHAGDAGRESVPVCHKRYLLMHNNDTRVPDYVLEHLTATQVSGDNNRPGNSFSPEPAVPQPARAVDNDYRRSGYARGHQAPSEDFNIDSELMLDTFYFSNVVPQVGNGFNSGIWSTLESRVRDLAVERGEIYVITGPIYQASNGASQVITEAENACGRTISLDPPRGQTRKAVVCDANNRDAAVPCGDDGAAVPAALFKIIYDPVNDRANAYVLPNIDHKELRGKTKPMAYLDRFRTTVHVVEEYTGLTFFSALSARHQRVRKLNCTATMLR